MIFALIFDIEKIQYFNIIRTLSRHIRYWFKCPFTFNFSWIIQRWGTEFDVIAKMSCLVRVFVDALVDSFKRFQISYNKDKIDIAHNNNRIDK